MKKTLILFLAAMMAVAARASVVTLTLANPDGTPNTNVVKVAQADTNQLYAVGNTITTIGVPMRVQPDTNGIATIYRTAGDWAIYGPTLGSGLVWRSVDASSNTNGFFVKVPNTVLVVQSNTNSSGVPLTNGFGAKVAFQNGTNIVSADTNTMATLAASTNIVAGYAQPVSTNLTGWALIPTNGVTQIPASAVVVTNGSTVGTVPTISPSGSQAWIVPLTNGEPSITAGNFYGSGQYLTGLPSGITTNAITAFTNVGFYGMVRFSVANGMFYYYPVYTNSAPAYFTLTVSNGTGGGSYTAGSLVGINTNSVIFTNWSQQVAGMIINTNAATTALIMPNSNVWVSANYFSSGGGSYSNMVTSYSPSATRNDLGWSFGCVVVPSNNVTVYSIGRYVVSGNSGTHTLHITTYPGNVDLRTVSLNTSGKPVGFSYVTLGTPLTLTNGANYFIASDEAGGGDLWNDDSSGNTGYQPIFNTVSFPAYSAYATAGAGSGGGISFHSGATNTMYVGVDIQYTKP